MRERKFAVEGLSKAWDINDLAPPKKSPSPCVPFKITEIVRDNTEHVISQLMEIYQILCSACFLINQIFQLQILCFSLNSFLGIVFFMYYILIFNSLKVSHDLIDRVIPYLWIQVLGCILDVVAIVCACTYVTRSARKISWTVAELLYRDNLAQGAKDQLTKFALQLIHVYPQFTIFGMFNVDGTLLFTVAGASTTYLIILFQFTASDDKLADGILAMSSTPTPPTIISLLNSTKA